MKKPPEVLLVQDKSQKPIVLAEALRSPEYLLVKATSSEDALNLISSHNFAVIILDTQMTGIGYFEITHLIRTRKNSKFTPIIFINADKEHEKAIRNKNLGVVYFVFKPVNTENLKHMISSFVHLFNDTLKEMVKAGTTELLNIIDQLKFETSKNKKSEETVKKSDSRFKAVFEGAGIGIAMLKVSEKFSYLLEMNPTMQKMLDYKLEELNNINLLKLFHPDERKKAFEFNRKIMAGKNNIKLETRLLNKDSQAIWVSITWSFINDLKSNKVGVIMLEDITERKNFEHQLTYLATHDYLTGIPNRYSFEENLKRVVAIAKRGVKSALIFMDIDNFKLINDTKGHAAGDEILVKVVKILKSNIRTSDFLARLGGDEFAILLENVSLARAVLIAEKLRETVDRSDIYLPNHCLTHNISISVGVVIVDGTMDSQKLLSLADTALYVAKDSGRNRVSVINPNDYIIDKLSEVNEIISLIKKALKNNLFKLLYQPIFDIEKRKVLHFEALLRLIDKDGNLISPATFIPIAERFGLMPQIDQWVTQQAIKELEHYSNIKIFVNLSGSSLDNINLLNNIEKLINNSNIQPSRLGFEITETAVIKDLTMAEQWIKRLKQLGCQFALDDFGIGFSSFSYLKMLSVDYLKIDGTFVKNLDTEPTNVALVKAMKAVANSLGKKTIAEYIVNENVLKILKELNVEGGQGYYLGKPDNNLDK